MKPTVGSLFAGIGGFDLGFERAGFETAWQVEINEWCRKVLTKNFPKAERYADIREVGINNLKRVDVIVGGFPCQDISVAGLNAGIDGERSGLWSEYARIIGELRPSFTLVENVAALLGRGIDRVAGDLAALGYDAEWEVVSAADVGAPHLRERVWILAYPRSLAREQRLIPDLFRGRSDEAEQAGMGNGEVSDSGGGRCGPESGREVQLSRRTEAIGGSEDVADSGLKQRDRWRDWTCGWGWEPEEALRDARGGGREEAWMSIPESLLGRVAYGVPAVVDRLRGLGNAVVPQIPELYARRIKELLDARDSCI